MSNTANKVIEYALSQVGYLEKKTGDLKYLYDKEANAGFNNYTMYGYEMHKLYPEAMDYPAYWCDAFVDCCFYKCYGIANAKKLLGGNFDDYTKNSINLYKKQNAFFLKNQTTPLPGDQIFFSKDGTFSGVYHTALVVETTSNIVYTVEGNTSNSKGVEPNGGGVWKKSYPLTDSKIYGYGRPAYDAEELQKSKIWTSADGIKILASSLNVRKEPSITAEVITTYKKDYVVKKVYEKVLTANKHWFLSDDGWFSANYCEGWILEENGRWWYLLNNYQYPSNEIKTISDKDYVFDKSGWLITADRVDPKNSNILY